MVCSAGTPQKLSVAPMTGGVPERFLMSNVDPVVAGVAHAAFDVDARGGGAQGEREVRDLPEPAAPC